MNPSDLTLRRSWYDPATRIVREAQKDTAERMRAESVEALLDQLKHRDPANWSE